MIRIICQLLVVCTCALALPGHPLYGALSVGDILVTEYAHGVIRVDPVTGDRAWLSGNGVGSGPAFGQISGIAVAADGSVLVADELNDAVIRIDSNTGNRTIVSSAVFGVGSGPELSRPFGIVLDATGKIYVSDFGRNEILSIDSTTGNRAIYSGAGTMAVEFRLSCRLLSLSKRMEICSLLTMG